MSRGIAKPQRVAVTGLGIISSIGNSLSEVETSLRSGRSGIIFAPDYAERGFRSRVKGEIDIDVGERIDRRLLRFMGPGSAYAWLAARQAIEDSGLSEDEIASAATGLVAGSGGPSTSNQVEAARILSETGSPKRMGPYMVTRCMSSGMSANLATALKLRGPSFSISSACSTSAHCILVAADYVRRGVQEVMLAGGGEELHWSLSMLFDAMGAMSSGFNDSPEGASRPYDAGRDGFVISGGAGMLVLEAWDRARARGAHIWAELVGGGITSDGVDMVAPSGEGAARCMREALDCLEPGEGVDYINTHGTSTVVGDGVELGAIGEVFGDMVPPLSSTKSLTGHAQGAAGAIEAVFSLLSMRGGFCPASANLDAPDETARRFPIVRGEVLRAPLNVVLSNSFGFGGTNCTLAFRATS
ncbi:MAG: beta-ketoacyl-ACP synthase I [Alphaproteobacteria bacterium]